MKPRNRDRWFSILLATFLAVWMATSSASAISFKKDESGSISVPTLEECPTLKTQPRPYEVWFNIDDMETRGYYDPYSQAPWGFPKKIAQVICGARQGAEIKIGMYFVRAIGTMSQPGLKSASAPGGVLGSRPETDPEVIWDALEYVVKKRQVKVGLVLEGGSITAGSAKSLIYKRLLSIAKISGFNKTNGIELCTNGCFNLNKANEFPAAINHEKFATISDTIWDGVPGPARSAALAKPAVLSSSGNWARSQFRNFWQEATLIYDDHKLFEQFDARYDGMAICAHTGCKTNKDFPPLLKKNLALKQNIWVDQLNPHGTDSGRGTYVTFSPQPSTVVDPYIATFDNVDCAVDKKIRIAMFKLTDSKAVQMVNSLAQLKARGCDIKMLLTQQGGATTISPAVVQLLKAAEIPTKCTAVAMHTKLIMIGPMTNDNGRVLQGTANMSTASARTNDEHTITFDSRRAAPAFQDDIRRIYGTYLASWYELSQGSKACR